MPEQDDNNESNYVKDKLKRPLDAAFKDIKRSPTLEAMRPPSNRVKGVVGFS